MKYKIKKLIGPLLLILLGASIFGFITIFNPKVETQKKRFKSKYIAIKIKKKYPFPLLFLRGTKIKTILKKFNVGAQEIYIKKKPMSLETRIYEDSTLQIS